MTEQEAKYIRKRDQVVKDALNTIPECYTIENLSNDLAELRRIENMPGERKLSTKMIAGLLRWQIDNL